MEQDVKAAREFDDLSPEEKAEIQLNNFIKQMPVLVFNSAKYDLQLVKQMLAQVLELDKSGGFAIKKGSAYTCMGNNKFKFLDIAQFLVAGTSYDVFLKAYKCQQTKSYFPYEWLDDASKLDHPALPEFDTFYSQLKQHNVLDIEYDNSGNYSIEAFPARKPSYLQIQAPPSSGLEKYRELQQIWKRNNMKTWNRSSRQLRRCRHSTERNELMSSKTRSPSQVSLV